jgi:hypothetical protein
VPAAYAIASPAMARPASGVSSTIRRSTCGRRNRASHRMPVPRKAATTPIASAQRNSAALGSRKVGRCWIASENVPSPLHEPRPRKISDPIPAATSPGSSTSSSMAPRLRVARAAKKTPGGSAGVGAPAPALNRSAGECPPVPGRYRIASAVSSPESTSGGTGHQSGSEWKPSPCGRLVKIHPWSLLTKARKPQATAETGTPMTAARTRGMPTAASTPAAAGRGGPRSAVRLRGVPACASPL